MSVALVRALRDLNIAGDTPVVDGNVRVSAATVQDILSTVTFIHGSIRAPFVRTILASAAVAHDGVELRGHEATALARALADIHQTRLRDRGSVREARIAPGVSGVATVTAFEDAESALRDFDAYVDSGAPVQWQVGKVYEMLRAVLEETEWEYRPKHGPLVRSGTISPEYVDEYVAEGGTVVRRRVGPYETYHPHPDNRCCRVCGTHSMPHRGCILR